MELKLFPYKTISNRTGKNLDIGGIIEVVPNCLSRDMIGKTNEESLYEFFINNFGAEHSLNFQLARSNLRLLAGDMSKMNPKSICTKYPSSRLMRILPLCRSLICRT